MRAHIPSSVIAGVAIAGIGALAGAPMAPPPGKKGSDPGTATSKSSATRADVDHPVKHEKKVHDPASTKDGHPDRRPDAKAG